MKVCCDRGGEQHINKHPVKQRDVTVKRATGTQNHGCGLGCSKLIPQHN